MDNNYKNLNINSKLSTSKRRTDAQGKPINNSKGNPIYDTVTSPYEAFDVKLEQQFLSDVPQGIQQGYFTSTFGNEDGGDFQEIIGAKFIKPFDDEGNSITAGYSFNHIVDESTALAGNQAQCDNLWLCVPNISVPDGVKDLGNVDESSSFKWKTVEDINKIADEIDNVQDARTLVEFLSSAYKQLDIQAVLKPKLDFLVQKYNLVITPKKLEDYADLSAYLNAPFKPVITIPEVENEELKKIINELDKLGLEDLQIPLVEVIPEDLTERKVDGKGIFDFLGSSVMNQLEMMTNRGLITKGQVADIYSNALVQSIQTSAQFSLEKANILNQSYGLKVQAVQASVQVLQAKAQMLMMPVQIRLQYAQLEAQLKQLELLKVQTELEKEKYPQLQAQTDLILAQTDGQRVQNEQAKVAVQTAELGIEQAREQIALMQEQNKQAQIATKLQALQVDQQALANNKLIEDTKLSDAQTQLQLKQVMLADVQKIQAKANIKLQAQQLEKEKLNQGLIKAQTATAYAQLATLKEQMRTMRAQYNDKIDGKRIGGVLGAQIAVNKAQAVGFERDAFIKFMNQAQSGWSAKKTADVATLSPSSYTAVGVDRLMTWGATKLFNMPNDTFKMPNGYSDYLTDDEMDATVPTTSSSNSKITNGRK